MTFYAPSFAVFFAAVYAAVAALNARHRTSLRNGVLTAASWCFYGTLHYLFPLLLLYSTSVCHLFGRAAAAGSKRAAAAATLLCLLPLLFFKYAPGYLPGILLPAGLSFFTFQAVSYIVDLYRKRLSPAGWGEIALCLSFFPTLTAGPIERLRRLLPQLRGPLPLSYSAFASGGGLFLWGLFQKTVVADRLRLYVDLIYGAPELNAGSSLALAALLYSFCIYADFSGYTDMARGLARTLGVELMPNFRFPYLAGSFREFWRRWHISLTSWFADYVYRPLGGNRAGRARWLAAVAAVFILSALWHGTAAGFVVWGALHACFYATEQWIGSPRGRLRLLYAPAVFLCITLAWVFFRLPTDGQALTVIGRIISGPWLPFQPGASMFTTATTLSMAGLFIAVELLQSHDRLPRSVWFRLPAAAVLIILILLLSPPAAPFIYYKF